MLTGDSSTIELDMRDPYMPGKVGKLLVDKFSIKYLCETSRGTEIMVEGISGVFITATPYETVKQLIFLQKDTK